MKYLKMLGLAAVAAAALMALVGAGTASAAETSLCSTNTNPCSSPYPADTTIKAQLKSGTTAVVTAGIFGDLTVAGSSMTMTTTATSGAPLPVDVTGMTLTGVTHDPGGESCEVAVEGLPYSGSITTEGKSANGNGSFTYNNLKYHIVCGTSVNCTFTAASINFRVVGGSPAEMMAFEVPLTATGGFCPTTEKLDATYTVTSPTSLFVV